jgi:hypothetical protein
MNTPKVQVYKEIVLINEHVRRDEQIIVCCLLCAGYGGECLRIFQGCVFSREGGGGH